MQEYDIFYRQIMQRYGVDAVLKDMGPAFIAALVKAFGEKIFCATDFEGFPIELVTEYIQRTHIFYLQKKLPEIEQSIFHLSELYNAGHPVLAALNNFFHRYSTELDEHIREEETRLLPYIRLLLRCLRDGSHTSLYVLSRQEYCVTLFLEGHHDTEDELADIRRVIQLYNPPEVNASLYRILLSQLQSFERDLQIHAHIENQVLLPRALQMELILYRRINHWGQLN
ncbi:MAG TPA: hypothetical protein VG738_19375 [Chitinophagaceae bacterium]|nr:hypothetical protein [Chitinophagaceae bacterium]